MIPVTLPISLMIFLFLILIGFSLLLFVGSSHVFHLIRSRAPRKRGFEGAQQSLSAPSPAGAAAEVSRVEGYVFPHFLRYHRGHTWVAFKESGEAIVGIDDFAGKLIGSPKIIASPRIGQRLHQEERAWILRRKGKDLEVQAPLDGEVVEVNERIFDNPGLLSKDCYGGGWLAVIKPANLKENMMRLLSGEAARQWLEQSAAEVRATFNRDLGLVYQDGGLPEGGLADYLNPNEWAGLLARLSGCGRMNPPAN
ncbi:MAG: hypothetical protein C4520_12525 [Candidatus Abyssobacteria bacterium SURF_5]|uniref:Glycine cleavage system protein H n=1 Tax=Abyssobacteria bacterium (strain SURF_5) TaxID=2093360 RepID=A0A3A4NGB1_ABYX5|nr:MAG: hypothetical protein C4520_12525 [Candidatus Abyssubacteria bacterium SURF_5]